MKRTAWGVNAAPGRLPARFVVEVSTVNLRQGQASEVLPTVPDARTHWPVSVPATLCHTPIPLLGSIHHHLGVLGFFAQLLCVSSLGDELCL